MENALFIENETNSIHPAKPTSKGIAIVVVCLILINPKSLDKILFPYSYCIYRNHCLNLPVVDFSQRKPSIPAFPTSFDLNLNRAPSVIFMTIIGIQLKLF